MIVDEFQDTSALQYALLRLLTSPLPSPLSETRINLNTLKVHPDVGFEPDSDPSNRPDAHDADAANSLWKASVMCVGDPNQSIYGQLSAYASLNRRERIAIELWLGLAVDALRNP